MMRFLTLIAVCCFAGSCQTLPHTMQDSEPVETGPACAFRWTSVTTTSTVDLNQSSVNRSIRIAGEVIFPEDLDVIGVNATARIREAVDGQGRAIHSPTLQALAEQSALAAPQRSLTSHYGSSQFGQRLPSGSPQIVFNTIARIPSEIGHLSGDLLVEVATERYSAEIAAASLQQRYVEMGRGITARLQLEEPRNFYNTVGVERIGSFPATLLYRSGSFVRNSQQMNYPAVYRIDFYDDEGEYCGARDQTYWQRNDSESAWTIRGEFLIREGRVPTRVVVHVIENARILAIPFELRDIPMP